MNKRIGLFGFGTVAQGFYEILRHNTQLGVEVVKICIKNPEKLRSLDSGYFTTDPEVILQDPSIDIVVELIDDADVAYDIVKRALQAQKGVISANKRMIAEHMEEVSQWHQDYSAPFLYEGAVGGSIPILHNLEQFFKQQEITSIRGILNGSTNYVLSKMRTEKLSFEDALELAQSEGFAESDPSLDISGKDAMFKLIILAYHAFGQTITDFSQIRVESITNMEDQFYELAELQGQKIKSVATAYRKANGIRLKIQPELVEATDALYGVENEYNAIIVDANYSGNQIFSGKGAGSLPTASAVINDLSLLINGFKYGLKRPQSTLKKSA